MDVGGGDSRLVDALLARGLRCMTVLDIALASLARAGTRIGHLAEYVRWLNVDVTDRAWQVDPVDFWHDRAVFHFLIDDDDRRRYVERLRSTVKPGGAAIIATFAPTGPSQCSGLPVARYSSAELSEQLGPEFALARSVEQQHRTPAGTLQLFQWSQWTRVAPDGIRGQAEE